MKSWSRMQDVVAVVIGVFAALSPMWVDTNNAARWSLIVLGALVALSGLVHMARPEMGWAEYAMGIMGVLLFLSPWVMGFSGMGGAAWTAWVVGVLAVVVAVTGLPMMSSRMHGHGGLATHH
ncbi:SPW repeat protein [Rhodococcus sp. NPDC058521]|uniref:SPW repeat domain-containing protein n=1 Tax=Rhodococcus sp. NPDC058521 TaxID=3346536 RepID=UPI0036519DA9